MALTYWMLVSSPDNFERARSMGFPLLAMKSRHVRKAAKVQPGDRIVYYATGVMSFAGTFTAASTYSESHEPLFTSKKDGEDYPFRFDVSPNVVLPSGHFVPATTLLGELEFVKKWPTEHWHLAFQGNVHTLTSADFEIIEQAMKLVLAREESLVR